MKKGKKILALLSAFMLVAALAGTIGAEETLKININTASAEELSKLKRVGLKHAARIVEYRTKNGPFQKPEDITLVRGIGSKTYELNKDIICIE